MRVQGESRQEACAVAHVRACAVQSAASWLTDATALLHCDALAHTMVNEIL